MSKVAKKYQDELASLKCMVEDWQDYFSENNSRFNDFKRFVFDTSLSAADKETLRNLGKPIIEFNVCEAYLSRLRGNFAEHEPSVTVSAAEGVGRDEVTPSLIKTTEFIEAHMREIFDSSRTNGLEYRVYTDCLAGGFSSMRVGTEYANEMSFNQKIVVEAMFDPSMVGFDPMARESHKGDGNYCFEIVPTTKEDFESRYGEGSSKDISFNRSSEGFNWSYSSEDGKNKVALVVYFYKKVKKSERIVKLTNGKSILKKHYPQLVEIWNEKGLPEQVPQVVNERKTEIETIYLYEFCENKVFKVTPTSYSMLPIVFIDGNSVELRQGANGRLEQFTRPYLYHAKGVQKLKNFAGQTMAAEIENMVQQKWVAAKEGIPPEYEGAYENPQEYQTMVYNAFSDRDPDKPIPPPREVQRVPPPAIVESIFMGMDAVTQSVLGSYDAQQGNINGKELSGKAIQAGAMQSDSAAKPYMMGYVCGLNRVAQIVLNLIPKYYVSPRSVPIIKANGQRDFVYINDRSNKDSPSMKYEPHSLQVKVGMGVNSAVQKQIALDYLVRLMGASELFAEFINSEGLESLLDNIDIRGVDRLKVKAGEFMEQRKKAMEASANQQSPEDKLLETQLQIENNKTEQKAQEAQLKHGVSMSELAIKQEKVDQEWYDIISKIDEREAKQALEAAKIDAENARTIIDASQELMSDSVDYNIDIYDDFNY